MTNRINWIDANGEVPAANPTTADELIFDASSYKYYCNWSGHDRQPEYRKITLRGTSGSRFEFYGDCPTNKYQRLVAGGKVADYDFYHALEYVNETPDGDMYLIGQDPQCAPSTTTVYATNLVNVVHSGASITWNGHLQGNAMGGSGTTVIRKTGEGTFIPFTGHCYVNPRFVTEHGTTQFKTHGSRDWPWAVMEFLGDDPNATFEFQWAKCGDYGGHNGRYWSQYYLSAAPRENGVTNHLHSFVSYNGATLLYSNKVGSCTFTGRFRGSLNFTWWPNDASKTWTFDGGKSDTTGTNWIANGTVALTNSAQFTSLSRLIVEKSGVLDVAAGCAVYAKTATIRGTELAAGFHKASELKLAGLTGDGAIVVGPSSISVPYDSKTKTATLVDLTGSTAFTAENLPALAPINVALSERIAFTNGTLHATNRWAVAKFAAGMELKAEHFVDVSAKRCDLPVTWFELVNENDGMTLYLVARPVVASRHVGVTGPNGQTHYYMMSNPDMWSDGQVAHAGADYYCCVTQKVGAIFVHELPADVARANPVTFPGESLTMDKAAFYPYANDLTINLRVYNSNGGNEDFVLPYSGGRTFLRGNLYVDNATCANPWHLRSNDGTGAVVQELWKWDSPNGFVFYNTWSTTPHNSYEAYWDASKSAGCTKLSGSTYMKDAANLIWFKLDVAITNKFGLGGPMPKSGQAGVRFSGWPRLTVNETLDFDVTNRNWHSEDCGLRLAVAESKIFTLSVPYYCRIRHGNVAGGGLPFEAYMTGRCCVEKSGEGTFALASQIIPCDENLARVAADGTNNLVRVVAGGVMQKSENAFDGVKLEFHDGTRIAADPAKPFAVKTTLAPAFADGATVDLVAEGANLPVTKFTLPVLSVPSATADLTSRLCAKGYWTEGTFMSPRLEKSSDGELTTYSVSYRRMGTAVLVR